MALRDASAAARGARAPETAARDRAWEGAVPLLVAVFLDVLMLAAGQNLLHDGDTFLHIAAGNWIWTHGAVPRTDPFSFTRHGAPWVAHEWLAELGFAAAYRALGWTGVIALSAGAIAATYYMLARFLARILPTPAVLVGVTASFLLAAPHLLARPHVLTMPLLVLWVAAHERAREEGRAPALLLLPAMTLWANLHGGFVIGLGLTALYALDALASAADRRTRLRSLRTWAFFGAAVLLAALLTPFGINGPLFALHLARETYALGMISEWHSTDFSRFQPLEIWIAGLLLLGFTLRPRLGLFGLALLLGLVHFALAHSRNADLLALIGPMILAAPVARALGSDGAHHAATPRRRSQVAGAAIMIAATVVLCLHPIRPQDGPSTPREAVAAARKAGLTGPVFNAYDFGGYLIFAGLHPFDDGRIDLYGDRFMADYMDAVAARDDALPRLIERYHIAWALLAPDMPAAQALGRLPGWRRVYADADAVVYRRGPLPDAPRPPSP
jgi:hypothetical protein